MIVAGGGSSSPLSEWGHPEQYQCKELKEIDDGPYLSMGITAENVARLRSELGRDGGPGGREPPAGPCGAGGRRVRRRDRAGKRGPGGRKHWRFSGGTGNTARYHGGKSWLSLPCFLEDGLATAGHVLLRSDSRAAAGS